jgi:hypothetical protein
MILNLFQPIFDFLGIGFFLLPPDVLTSHFATFNNWWELLSPEVLISWLIYFMTAYGVIFVLFIMPFRFFKKLLHVPKRKG